MNDSEIDYMAAALGFVAPNLGFEEAIIAVTRGQTAYGRVVSLFFKVDIATFVHRSGNDPLNPRTLYVSVDSNPPHEATAAKAADWLALSPVATRLAGASADAHQSDLLDEALDESFPASDPPSMTQPGPR